ncbi:hypothetical protein METP1_00463 [Methanosarcinales archaeon]|nr:hypothetical protein METP1_00463 [Methanosarcinales archaeon]
MKKSVSVGIITLAVLFLFHKDLNRNKTIRKLVSKEEQL